MIKKLVLYTIVLTLAALGAAQAQSAGAKGDTLVSSKVKSLGLFKNGVVVVQEEIPVTGKGTYVLPEVPMALHGTFFIDSDALVETTVTERAIAEPLRLGETLDYQNDLAGRAVVVYLNPPELGSISGVVAVLQDAKPAAPETLDMRRERYYGNPTPQPTGNLGSKLILETDGGQVILERSAISRVDLKDKVATVKRIQPAMVFEVKSDKPAVIRLTYLTRGISWAPSYRIDTSNPGRLSIEQTAVLVNDLKSFENAEVSLISGFPKIECENVYAPFAPGNSLDAFFRQLANRDAPGRESMMTQQVAYVYNSVAPSMPGDSAEAAVAVAGEGPDIHFQDIGTRNMKKGDRLVISNGKAEADYERIVEWKVPDPRDDNGRYRDPNRDPNISMDAWDTLRFRNPLPFPMTTGPATILADGHFYGQNTSFWASPGELTRVPVTKSMSVRVKAIEFEKEPESWPRVEMWGHTYRRATIGVELTIVNRRAEPVSMVVNRRFSGELTEEVPDARIVAVTENLNRENRVHEIQWEFTLASGETKVLRFTYNILVD